MTMHCITLSFTPTNRIKKRQVTALGLHGLLFNVLRQANPSEADWLHGYSAPKPFSLAALYTSQDFLVGIRLTAMTERVASFFLQVWQAVCDVGYPLRFGSQTLKVNTIVYETAPDFYILAMSLPVSKMKLQFLSPTSFKQGPGSLLLPLPRNVFARPLQTWQTFAPANLRLPDDWLVWCEREVFVIAHRIQTVQMAINKREKFEGFVGEVEFEALTDTKSFLQTWQALGELAVYSGVGHKTTMGMGVVEKIVEAKGDHLPPSSLYQKDNDHLITQRPLGAR